MIKLTANDPISAALALESLNKAGHKCQMSSFVSSFTGQSIYSIRDQEQVAADIAATKAKKEAAGAGPEASPFEE